MEHRWLRRGGLLSIGCCLVVTLAGGCRPPAKGDLTVAPTTGNVAQGDIVELHAVETNLTGAPCLLSRSGDFSLTVVSETLNGKALSPYTAEASYDDGYATAVDSSLVSIPAGGTIDLDYRSSPGAGGQEAFQVATGTNDEDAGTQDWPIGAAGNYQIVFRYHIAGVDGLTTGTCASTGGTATAQFSIGGTSTAPEAHPHVASATGSPVIKVAPGDDPGLATQTQGNLDQISQSGPPDEVETALDSSEVTIVPNPDLNTDGGGKTDSELDGTEIITYNPNYNTPLGVGVPDSGLEILYHELFHAGQILTFGYPDVRHCIVLRGGANVNTKIPVTEVDTTRAENEFRSKRGIGLRTTYGRNPLPSSTEKCEGLTLIEGVTDTSSFSEVKSAACPKPTVDCSDSSTANFQATGQAYLTRDDFGIFDGTGPFQFTTASYTDSGKGWTVVIDLNTFWLLSNSTKMTNPGIQQMHGVLTMHKNATVGDVMFSYPDSGCAETSNVQNLTLGTSSSTSADCSSSPPMINDLTAADQQDPLFVLGGPEINTWQPLDPDSRAEGASADSRLTLNGESGIVSQTFTVQNGCTLQPVSTCPSS